MSRLEGQSAVSSGCSNEAVRSRGRAEALGMREAVAGRPTRGDSVEPVPDWDKAEVLT